MQISEKNNRLIYPGKLRRGSRLGLVAISSPVTEQRKELCIEAVKKMGYEVKLAENLTEIYGGYAAGDAKKRGRQINRMFEDKDVDGILCIRGGYGASSVIEHVDLETVRKNPKAFIGFSDVTVFHLLFNQKCGLITFHGPMASSNMIENFESETEEALMRAVACEGTYRFVNPGEFQIKVMKHGKNDGRTGGIITGGNLSLLSSSMGTVYEMDSKNKIIFIEEVNEPVGRIERMARHLKECGKFNDCRGVLLGQFEGCINGADREFDAVEVFREILSDIDIPVMYNLQSGHGRPMITLPMGAPCHIDTFKKTIIFDI